MNGKFLRLGVNYILTALTAAFASHIAVALAGARVEEGLNYITPVFGVAVSIVLVGGYRYLPAVFIGAVLPEALAKGDVFAILSAPLGAVAAATVARRLLLPLGAVLEMKRMRDASLVFLWAAVVATLVGSLLQTLLLAGGAHVLSLEAFGGVVLLNWLSAGVGTAIVMPFVLTWSRPANFHPDAKQLLEVSVWSVALLILGLFTFEHWAPIETLSFPLELAIFPIMAWAAARFGLRITSAGVLALALLAAWEFAPVLPGQVGAISQSPANVWFFVAIVSATSMCLAALVTDLRRREEALTRNESRLRDFTGSLPDIAFVFNANGQILDVFSASDEMSASHRIFNADSVRGKMIGELFNASVCEGFIETIRSVLDHDQARTFEYSLQSVDVGKHWFEARVTPMRLSEGRSDRVVWLACNISQRKSSEEVFRHRDRILRATARANNSLLTNTGFDEAVASALSEIGRAMRVDRALIIEITESNDGEFHRFSIKHEWLKRDFSPSLLANPTFQNAPFEEFCPGWYELLVESGIVNLDYDTASEDEIETLNVLKARAVLAIPLWKNGRLHGFFSVDHCERTHRWTESEINAVRLLASGFSGLVMIQGRQEYLRSVKDAANAASIAKGEYLAMMSHEIRTPMNAIIGYTDLLFQSELDEWQSEHASIIKRSGRALLDLINNILDYSKIESRSLELEVKKFDIEQIICEALDEVLPLAKDKLLEVDYEIDPNVKEFYLGDAHRLRQILLNLSNNAIKFTSKGTISIRVALEEIDSENEADVLHFEVIDTGPGVPVEKYEMLFQPFTQVDSSTTRRFGGTGLGLVISRRLVECMNGKIWIESEVGQGSNFQFHIRLKHAATIPGIANDADGSEEDDDDLEPDFAKGFPLRLLLCEDDKENRWVIRELLEILGYRPDVVESSEEALSQMKNRAYDAVLMDVRLPGMSGIEVTQAIRSGQEKIENQDQYIIAVTAYAMNEDRQKCLNVGMNDYIRKPVEISELKEALKRAHQAPEMSSLG